VARFKIIFVYTLKCKDSSYYTGITFNLEKRLLQHNSGIKTSIQKSKRPIILVYYEKYSNRIDAVKREKKIKVWRREKKEKLINSLTECNKLV